jgi:hypothetical protein
MYQAYYDKGGSKKRFRRSGAKSRNRKGRKFFESKTIRVFAQSRKVAKKDEKMNLRFAFLCALASWRETPLVLFLPRVLGDFAVNIFAVDCLATTWRRAH